MKQQIPNIQNAPALVRTSWMLTNVLVTTNARPQLVNVAIETPGPLTFSGSNSPAINHGTGPAPIPKAAMKRIKETNGNQPRDSTIAGSVDECSFR